jgi:serine/threonine-protein kinase
MSTAAEGTELFHLKSATPSNPADLFGGIASGLADEHNAGFRPSTLRVISLLGIPIMKTNLTVKSVIEDVVERLAKQLTDSPTSDSREVLERQLADIEQQFRSTLRDRFNQRSGTEVTVQFTPSKEKIDRDLGASGDFSVDAPHEGLERPLEKAATKETIWPSPSHMHTVRLGHSPLGYELLEVLGKGGMGIVYKAYHLPLQRVVAMKMILGGDGASVEQIARFQREAEAAAQLTHPNIVSVYEVGSHRGLPYFSLEYVEGSSLAELLKGSTFDDRRAVDLMLHVAEAVEYSHQHGILHRDLKPQNILVSTAGVPKVADFGLAKRLTDGGEHTRTGDVLGTPGYMPPEQARGEKTVGPYSDVYSLGAILYCVLTGRAPFVGPTPFETLRQVVTEDPIAPSRLQPKLNRDLETICLKCLEKEPSKRYATAAELVAELQRVANGVPIHARPITTGERVWKWCRRNPRVAILGGIAATLLTVLFAGGYVAAGIINQQKVTEKDARQRAETNEQKAKTAEGVAKENEELAEQQADLALNATRIVLYKTQDFFKANPQLSSLRKGMLEGILKELDRVYAKGQVYDVKETFRATTLRQLGQIYYELGYYDKAMEYFTQSEQLAVKMHEQGRLDRPHLNLGTMDQWIGDTYAKLRKLKEAEQRFLSMIEHRRQYFAESPKISAMAAEQSMADAYGKLGMIYRRQERLDEALPLLESALQSRRTYYQSNPDDYERNQDLASALIQVSGLYEESGAYAKMQAASEEALQLAQRLVDKHADSASLQNLAVTKKMLGRQYPYLGEQSKAETMLQESLSSLRKGIELGSTRPLLVQAAEVAYLLARLKYFQDRDCTEECRVGLDMAEKALDIFKPDFELEGIRLRLVALSGDEARTESLSKEIVGNGKSVQRCLVASIGLSFLARKDGLETARRDELMQRAIEHARTAVIDLKFRNLTVLRDDPDFAELAKQPAYQEMLATLVASP